MLNLTELCGFGVGDSDAHRYWRVYCTASPNARFGLKEIEMRAVAGVSGDLCSGGTAIESSHYSTYAAANAYDNSASTYWIGASPAVGSWVGYTFATPQKVAQIVCVDTMLGIYYATGLRVDYSDDGLSWADAGFTFATYYSPDPIFAGSNDYYLLTSP